MPDPLHSALADFRLLDFHDVRHGPIRRGKDGERIRGSGAIRVAEEIDAKGDEQEGQNRQPNPMEPPRPGPALRGARRKSSGLHTGFENASGEDSSPPAKAREKMTDVKGLSFPASRARFHPHADSDRSEHRHAGTGARVPWRPPGALSPLPYRRLRELRLSRGGDARRGLCPQRKSRPWKRSSSTSWPAKRRIEKCKSLPRNWMRR